MSPQPPLADRMRPQRLEQVIGQEHLIGKGRILTNLIKNNRIPSLIFWGPPGVGKTTLAKILAHHTHAHFEQISAVLAGVKDIRSIVEQAKIRLNGLENQETILFIDEIHRFNKAQQDALLPHVEYGTLILIGATTENPSFEVNNALLSRTRVLTLKSLEPQHLKQILTQTLQDSQRGLAETTTHIPEELLDKIATSSNGDARTALNILEVAVQLHRNTQPKTKNLKPETLQQALQQTTLQYDRSEEEHYNTISAFIKSMRASDPDAALYYLARMVEGGEDPKFIARRMIVFASEDIGMSNPNALLLANEVFKTCETIGYPECAINLAHGVIYLATSSKDRRVYDALRTAQADVKTHGNLPIPLELRNAPTQLMKDQGYGKDYQMYPDKNKNLLPDKLTGKKYFK